MQAFSGPTLPQSQHLKSISKAGSRITGAVLSPASRFCYIQQAKGTPSARIARAASDAQNSGVHRLDENITVTDSERDNADPSASGSGADEGSDRQPFLIRVVKSLVFGIPLRIRNFLLSVAKFLMGRRSKWDMLFFSLLLLAAFPLFSGGASRSASAPQEVMYSDFRRLASEGFVRTVRIDESANQIYFQVPVRTGQEEVQTSLPSTSQAETKRRTWLPGRRKQPQPQPEIVQASQPKAEVETKWNNLYTKRINDPSLIPALLASGVQFGSVKVVPVTTCSPAAAVTHEETSFSGSLLRIVGSLLGLWLPLLPLIFIMRRTLGGRSGTKNKNKGGKGGKAPAVTFQDVAGADSAKAELLEVVQCFKDASRYTRLNASMPSGVLLCGPPGTGKTLLAKAVAGEAGVPFFAAAASEFVELFVGRGAARVRDLFSEARKRAPCVVFIDELDAVGGKRGLGLNEERDQTLNQLLTELDGFESRTGVLLLAATNRPEVLDSALTRPGRLSRRVVVPLPDEAGRASIMAVHLRNTPMGSIEAKRDACGIVARISNGMSGAELASVCNEGALLAGRRSAEVVELEDLIEAVERIKYGVNGNINTIVPRSWLKKANEWAVKQYTSNSRGRSVPTSM